MAPNEIGLMLGVGNDPGESLRKVASLGLRIVQLGYPGDAWLAEPKRSELKRMFDAAGVRVFTVFVAFEGEDYADIPTIRRTVGYLAPETRAERVARTLGTCAFAKFLGASYIHMHVGFVPVDPAHPQYAGLVDSLKRISDAARTHALGVALETGQEPADVLVRFIRDIGRDNVRVNFDPANMILYGSGNPHDALVKLAPWIVSIHCKDARPSTVKDSLGEETPLGLGAVDYPRLIRGLKSIGFTGPLIIEREISGPEQVRDVRAAIALIEKLEKIHPQITQMTQIQAWGEKRTTEEETGITPISDALGCHPLFERNHQETSAGVGNLRHPIFFCCCFTSTPNLRPLRNLRMISLSLYTTSERKSNYEVQNIRSALAGAKTRFLGRK